MIRPSASQPRTQAPRRAIAPWDPFRKPFKFPPSVPRCAVPRTRGPARWGETPRAHDRAPSPKELPRPAVQLFSVPSPGVCVLVARWEDVARGQPPTEPIRVRPSGTMSTEVTLRASPRQHATLAAESAGGKKPPWSNSAPTWRALGERAVQRAEGPRDDFEDEYGTMRGCPDKPDSPPIASIAGWSLFSFVIYPAASKRRAPRPRRFRRILLKSRQSPKGGKDKKCAHADQGATSGAVGPAAALARPGRGLFTPIIYPAASKRRSPRPRRFRGILLKSRQDRIVSQA